MEVELALASLSFLFLATSDSAVYRDSEQPISLEIHDDGEGAWTCANCGLKNKNKTRG